MQRPSKESVSNIPPAGTAVPKPAGYSKDSSQGRKPNSLHVDTSGLFPTSVSQISLTADRPCPLCEALRTGAHNALLCTVRVPQKHLRVAPPGLFRGRGLPVLKPSSGIKGEPEDYLPRTSLSSDLRKKIFSPELHYTTLDVILVS